MPIAVCANRHPRLVELAHLIGEPVDRTTRAVAGLARDGLVQADPAALRGDPAGRIGLAEA